MKTPREHLTEALNKTGIPWRYGGTSYHFNVFCSSNLKPWTTEQRAALDEAIQNADLVEYPAGTFERFEITQDACFSNGRYHEIRKMEPRRGFRVYLKRQFL